MPRARPCAAIALIVLLASARAAAAEPEAPSSTLIQTMGPRLLCMPTVPIEDCRILPVGRFLDEQSWQDMDAKRRDEQDKVTRLSAENRSLRGTLAGWQPGWILLTTTLVVGFVSGLYAASR